MCTWACREMPSLRGASELGRIRGGPWQGRRSWAPGPAVLSAHSARRQNQNPPALSSVSVAGCWEPRQLRSHNIREEFRKFINGLLDSPVCKWPQEPGLASGGEAGWGEAGALGRRPPAAPGCVWAPLRFCNGDGESAANALCVLSPNPFPRRLDNPQLYGVWWEAELASTANMLYGGLTCVPQKDMLTSRPPEPVSVTLLRARFLWIQQIMALRMRRSFQETGRGVWRHGDARRGRVRMEWSGGCGHKPRMLSRRQLEDAGADAPS